MMLLCLDLISAAITVVAVPVVVGRCLCVPGNKKTSQSKEHGSYCKYYTDTNNTIQILSSALIPYSDCEHVQNKLVKQLMLSIVSKIMSSNRLL